MRLALLIFGLLSVSGLAVGLLQGQQSSRQADKETCSCGEPSAAMPVALTPDERPAFNDQKWVSIFNGKNLDGWTPKIKGFDFGENFGNTFRVSHGAIQVNYDAYGGKFNSRFGHIFYKSKLKSFLLRLEYRFTGDQIVDGPGWAYRNSGIMLLCQDPKSMRKDQDFPVSIEYQLLGGNRRDDRHTGNVCTPGTNIFFNNQLWTQHCTDSTSSTFHGDQWVKAEVEVRSEGRPNETRVHVIHRINGVKVMEYEQPQLDPKDGDGKTLLDAAKGELMLGEGWISLQSESHPCEFRNIELMELKN